MVSEASRIYRIDSVRKTLGQALAIVYASRGSVRTVYGCEAARALDAAEECDLVGGHGEDRSFRATVLIANWVRDGDVRPRIGPADVWR